MQGVVSRKNLCDSSEAKHKVGYDSGMPIRNPGLELGLAGDEVIVQVISLAA